MKTWTSDDLLQLGDLLIVLKEEDLESLDLSALESASRQLAALTGYNRRFSIAPAYSDKTRFAEVP